jgi:hypothetical protein
MPSKRSLTDGQREVQQQESKSQLMADIQQPTASITRRIEALTQVLPSIQPHVQNEENVPSSGSALAAVKTFSTITVGLQLKCRPDQPIVSPARVSNVDPPNGAEFETFDRGRPSRPPLRERIAIVFDKRLQPETVVSDTVQVSVMPHGGKEQRVHGKLSYNDATKTVEFTPDSVFSGGTNENLYRVKVIGDGSSPLRDADGLALDGNRDGRAGGTFESTFKIRYKIT